MSQLIKKQPIVHFIPYQPRDTMSLETVMHLKILVMKSYDATVLKCFSFKKPFNSGRYHVVVAPLGHQKISLTTNLENALGFPGG